MTTEAVRRLIHDIKSKCSSLRDAAELLPETASVEKQELLELMEAQALAMAQVLHDERRRCRRG